MSFRERFIIYYSDQGQIQIDFLDSINFLPLLDNGKNLNDIIGDIEDKYDYGHMRDKIPKELKGRAFYYMDDYEFGLYLQERYPEWQIVEHVDTWYEVRRKNNGVNS